ncbi:MAG: DNA-processing protein DprA [Clostridia bacterium]|nr:DNA-processing protein DprA [Clostridia bacterium]
MYTEEEINLITLCSFEELTYKQRFTLLSDLTRAEPDFVKYGEILIKTCGDGVYNKVKDKFFSRTYREKILSKLNGRGIKCVTYFSKAYPENLKNIPCPPITLFCKGNVNLLKERCFAVVGSRKTPPNIIKECKTAANSLSQYFTVVTGMADGADTAAIEGALPSGKIISVLAYGFDHVYPALNENLLRKVEKSGLLITEYTPQIPPLNYNFPVRNRIIAGLSEGVLVVSGGRKSGAKITAGYALEYNRRVFAFPYSVGVESGEGCNQLIREGAALARNTLDVLSDFGLNFNPPPKPELTEEEAEILKLIKNEGEAFAPSVAEKLGKLPFQIIPALSSLEIKGMITRLGGNRYAALK